jgi:peptidoglycan/xylan/chitin deacetylase (PgdA/CDA1 family)
MCGIPVLVRRRIVAWALLVLLVTASAVLALAIDQPRWLVGGIARRSPEVLYFVDTSGPVVALTIDDGPDPQTTPEILQILKDHGAHATFFLISERVSGNEATVAEIVDAGHELGNHLTRDEPSVWLSSAEFEEELLEAHAVLSTFAPVRWMRPGSGWYNETMLSIAERHGYRCALGLVYPYDGLIPFADYAAFHVLRKAVRGSVIVLHDGGARGRRTAAALRTILPELQRRDLRVVTLSELVHVAASADVGQAGPAEGYEIGDSEGQ